jgi:hypothetical protein
MDTKYFLEALAKYSKANPWSAKECNMVRQKIPVLSPWSANLPLTPSALSEILQEAQKLKEKDQKKPPVVTE